jgi:hypothetical protein
MKSNSKLVLELIILPNSGFYHHGPSFLDDLNQFQKANLIRTGVRCSEEGCLNWIVNGVSRRYWGLANKMAYYLMDLDTQMIYPLYERRGSLVLFQKPNRVCSQLKLLFR